MHDLLERKRPIPTLYVKTAPQTYNINQVFGFARNLSPCMLILEDIETIVTPRTRSYFFNQMDGLEDNSGLFVIGSTNYLDRLDPGLTSRPSRFDRKYLFPLPNEHERTLYCQYWQQKISHKPDIKFPDILCGPMAKATHDFSFAFLQEAFVATLLYLAHEAGKTDDNGEDEDDDIEKYELWRVFKKQVAILRKEIRNESTVLAGFITAASHPISRQEASQYHHDDVPCPVIDNSQRLDMVTTGRDERNISRSFGQLHLRGDDDEHVVALQYSKRTMVSSAAYQMGLDTLI